MMSHATDTTTDDKDVYYIFVSQASFLTRHNLNVTGHFVSGGFAAAAHEALPSGTIMGWSGGSRAPQRAAATAAYENGTLDYLQFLPNPSFFGMLVPFGLNVINDYRVEYDAELGRRAHAPLAPSRLSAVYAFGDWATCERASSTWGWALADVRRFQLLPHRLNRVTRVNMEIVSLARAVYPRGSWAPEEVNEIWRAYWLGQAEIELDVAALDGRGRDHVRSGVIWEHLIEGVLQRIED